MKINKSKKFFTIKKRFVNFYFEILSFHGQPCANVSSLSKAAVKGKERFGRKVRGRIGKCKLIHDLTAQARLRSKSEEWCDALDRETDDVACASNTTDRRSSTIEKRDADDFKNQQERENNQKWQARAEIIDEGSRVIIPAMYVIFLAVMFGVSSKHRD